MLARDEVKKVIDFLTERTNIEGFRSHTTKDFIFEITGQHPARGEWRGVDAMGRYFKAFQEYFTSEFQFTASEIIVDAERNIAAVRLHSHPLKDKGGGDYQQHCGWFVYFNDDGKVTRIVQYDDAQLVNDVAQRVATANMQALQRS